MPRMPRPLATVLYSGYDKKLATTMNTLKATISITKLNKNVCFPLFAAAINHLHRSRVAMHRFDGIGPVHLSFGRQFELVFTANAQLAGTLRAVLQRAGRASTGGRPEERRRSATASRSNTAPGKQRARFYAPAPRPRPLLLSHFLIAFIAAAVIIRAMDGQCLRGQKCPGVAKVTIFMN